MKTLEVNNKVESRLYRGEDATYYVSHACYLPDIIGGGAETMVFKSNVFGQIDNYTDLGCVRFWDHYHALRAAGLDWKDFLK